jgi:hypothetical protein
MGSATWTPVSVTLPVLVTWNRYRIDSPGIGGIALLEFHRLRLPLLMAPRGELLKVAQAAGIDLTGLTRGLPDPFESALTPHHLTPRELEVLAALAGPPTS